MQVAMNLAWSSWQNSELDQLISAPSCPGMISILRSSFDMILPCVLDTLGCCKLPQQTSGLVAKTRGGIDLDASEVDPANWNSFLNKYHYTYRILKAFIFAPAVKRRLFASRGGTWDFNNPWRRFCFSGRVFVWMEFHRASVLQTSCSGLKIETEGA